MRIDVRPAMPADMSRCAQILNDWIDETNWMPRIYSREDVERHYREEVWFERDTVVADCHGCVNGYVTTDRKEFVTALYVKSGSRSEGIGKLLLQEAKQKLSPRIQLYTFQANTGAQAFYRREGFVEISRTDGDNEERLPDILLEWRAI